jgi:hypothetical protein
MQKSEKIPKQVQNFYQSPPPLGSTPSLKRRRLINSLMKIDMNDKRNQNNGVQFPEQNKTKKTQLEIQIAELQQREQQLTKQLKL